MTHTNRFNLLNSLHTEEVEEDEAHAFDRAIKIEGKKTIIDDILEKYQKHFINNWIRIERKDIIKKMNEETKINQKP